MVKCRDVEHRQWSAPGAWGWEEASEKTWIVASLSIRLLHHRQRCPTAHIWNLLSKGCLWILDSRSGPSLAQRPVKGCGATDRLMGGGGGGAVCGASRASL